ncbi:MAG: hypothetical protein NZO58_08925 [Gemmataceae bacterium]|nr:hypothetical protein [Gemmataceae bacterium]
MVTSRIAVGGWLIALTAVLSALLERDQGAVVRGVAALEGVPVADAIVRWQGSHVSTRSGPAGRFRLPAAGPYATLTAALPGCAIGVGSPRRPNVTITRPPESVDDPDPWIDPQPDPHRPAQCGNCHRAIFDEWSASAHGRSAVNPAFHDRFADLLRDFPLGSGVCAGCHVPTLSSPTLDYDPRLAQGVDRHGVHCDFCHKIADAPLDKLGTRFGRDGYRLVRLDGGRQLFFGPLDDAVRRGETFVFAPFYKESRYCASCHEGIIFGVHAYGTYSEWRESPAARQGKQCQDCHMPPTGALTNIAPGAGGVERDPRTLASHHLPGATADMLKRSLAVRTTALRRPNEVEIQVEVAARHVGHRMPTGFVERHLILVVQATEADGKPILPCRGPTLPVRAGPALHGLAGAIFGKQHVDAKGNALHFWQTGGSWLETRLRPEQAETLIFAFAATARRLRVHLLWRRFWSTATPVAAGAEREILIHEQEIDTGP